MEKFDRKEAKEKLKEMNIEFKGNASNKVLQELLANFKAPEVQVDLVDGEKKDEKTEVPQDISITVTSPSKSREVTEIVNKKSFTTQDGRIFTKHYNKYGDSVRTTWL